jgi:acyl dehydratase
MRCFEDIAVGQKSSYGNHAVTREDVLEFAAKFDPQPFHLSDEAAAQTHFGRLSASGWHSCAMAMRMIAEHFASVGHAGLGSPGIDELRFLKPVYPGDTLRVETEVLEKRQSRSKPEMGSFRSRIDLINQHGEVVVRFVAIDLIRLRGD